MLIISERSSYPEIGEAKIQADEYLVAMGHKRGEGFQAISLRLSWLTSSPTGCVFLSAPYAIDLHKFQLLTSKSKVQLGKTHALGQVSRASVANVAVELLSRPDTRGWFDLLQGSVEISEAVEKVVREGVDTIEGEDMEGMWRLAD